MMERIYTKTRWSLNDLFETHDGPDMKAAISKLEAKVTDFETVRQQLNDDIDQTEFLEHVEFDLELIEKIVIDKRLSICFNKLSSGSGSCSNTSKAAPPIIPSCNAFTRSVSFMTGPREVFITTAVGFIKQNLS